MVAHRTSVMARLCISSAALIACAKTPEQDLDLQDDDIPSPSSADASQLGAPYTTGRDRFESSDAGGANRANEAAVFATTGGSDASALTPATTEQTDGEGAASALDAAASPAVSAASPPPDDAGAAVSAPPPVQTAGASSAALTNCDIPADAQLEDVSHPTTVVGDGSPQSCSSNAFVDAVAKGGVITFDCGTAPLTITLDQTAKVFNDRSDKVVIDGGGKVTLSGGSKVRILYQNACDQNQVWTTTHCDNQEFPQLTVQNLTFVDGNAKSLGQGGGAIYAQGGRLKVINSQFYNNACPDVGPDVAGGALYAYQQYDGQPVYIVNSTFGGEPSRTNSGSNGGALAGLNVSFQILYSTLVANKAVGNGANPARAGTPGGGSGGAIYANGNTFTLRLCGSTVTENSANEGGGAIVFVSNDHTGQLILDHSTLQDNPSARFETYPGMFVQGASASTFTSTVIE